MRRYNLGDITVVVTVCPLSTLANHRIGHATGRAGFAWGRARHAGRALLAVDGSVRAVVAVGDNAFVDWGATLQLVLRPSEA